MTNQSNHISRRSFLKIGTTIAGASISNGALVGLSSAQELIPNKPLPRSALIDLEKSLSGRLISSVDANFKNIFLPNNLNYSKIEPLGVAVCQNESDIAKCLSWSKKHNISLVTRNGGHSYAGFSTTQGLMINIQALN